MITKTDMIIRRRIVMTIHLTIDIQNDTGMDIVVLLQKGMIDTDDKYCLQICDIGAKTVK